AFIMSSFKPISLVKGIGKSNNKFGLRSLLISFQFAISLFLIVCTIIMYSQVSLVSSQETGFRKDQVVVINLLELLTDFSDTTYAGRLETLKDRLKAFEIIKAATVTSQVPGKKSTWRGTERASNESSVVSYRTRIDSDFAEVFNIPLVAGRFFTTEDEQNAKRYMVVNESWVKATGFSSEDEAVGQIADMGVEYEIIGVLADFHQISPKYAIDPAIFTLGQGHRSYMSIAFKAESYQQVLQAVEQEWKRSFPDRPFKYFFLDDHFEKQFKSEARMSEAVSAFTLFSLFLACLGLVGLSTTIAYQKVKELGIRKVLGASVFDLLKLLSKGYLILVFFGSAVGLPLAYMVMDYWITGYAVKVQLSLIHFGLPVATVMLLTLLSTLSQSVNAAIKNPTDSLRQE
ncbi:MAG: ABC transporter permease, partial [Bacteroidota bacterium]